MPCNPAAVHLGPGDELDWPSCALAPARAFLAWEPAAESQLIRGALDRCELGREQSASFLPSLRRGGKLVNGSS